MSAHREPGTGTQIHAFASPPDVDDGLPCSMRINGTKWKVGHDYLDTEIGDVCELVEIIGRSSWCNTRDAEDCPPKLVFHYDRYERPVRVDPNDPRNFDDSELRHEYSETRADSTDSAKDDRFIERYTRDAPLGAPDPPW